MVFHTSAADSLKRQCFELALTFRCDLLTILRWPGSQVGALYADAHAFMAETRPAPPEPF